MQNRNSFKNFPYTYISKAALRLLCVLLVVILAFSAFGCGENRSEEKGETGSDVPVIAGDDSPSDIPSPCTESMTDASDPYVAEANRIVLASPSYASEYTEGWYVTVSGLKDKAVEQRVNDLIYGKFTAFVNSPSVPPYPGIEQEIPKGAVPHTVSVITTVEASFGNVLSLLFNVTLEYDGLFFFDQDALNIDLSTGEDISIAELFCDRSAGIESVNGYLRGLSAEDDSSRGYRITDGFIGISDDQKYFIAADSGQLVLILDYQAPWCEVFEIYNYAAVCIEPSGPSMYRRFGSGSIYENEKPSFVLLTSEPPESTLVRVNGYIEDFLGIKGFTFDTNTAYFESTSDRMKELLSSGFPGRDERLRDLASGHPFGDADGYALASSFPSHNGRFTNLEFSEYFHADGFTSFVTRYLVYRDGSDEPLVLSDMFKDGADPFAEIKKAVLSYAERTDGDFDMNKLSEFADKALEFDFSFALSNDSLIISYDAGVDALTELELAFGVDSSYGDALSCIHYEDLDASVMTVF